MNVIISIINYKKDIMFEWRLFLVAHYLESKWQGNSLDNN